MADKSSGFQGDLLLRNLAETEEFGRRIAPRLHAGDTLALKGGLGAGKTTLARAILQARGVRDEVPSPTFTLLQEYETAGLTIVHCDLYRISNPDEVDQLGLDEALNRSAVLIEWPERAPSRIPHDAVWLEIEIAGQTQRGMKISGPDRWAFLCRPENAPP